MSGGCFGDSNSADLKALLKQAGFIYATDLVDDNIGAPENGGLFIASRWRILAQSQHIYKNYLGGTGDSLATKGIGYAYIRKVVDGQAKYYHLFGTHMQSEHQEDAQRVRELQATEFKEFVDQQNIPTSEAVIHAGQFNSDYTRWQSHTARVLANMNVEFPDLVGDVRFTYNPETNDLADPKEDKLWIDYVAASKGFLAPKKATLEAFELANDNAVTVCWCKWCALTSSEYMYPDNAN